MPTETVKVAKGTVYIFDDSACLACTDSTGRIILVDQLRNPQCRATIELPGGNVILGESAKHAAMREFEEETALPRPLNAELLYVLDLDLSTSIHRTHLFKAQIDIDLSECKDHSGVVSMSPAEAIYAIKVGVITHAPTVAAILSMGVF